MSDINDMIDDVYYKTSEMDMRSRNLNHIKKRLTVVSALEDLTWIDKTNGDEKLSLHPVIENAVLELFIKRNPRLSSDIENEVKEELVNAIYTKINMSS